MNARALTLLLALYVGTAHAAPPFVIWDTVRTQFTRDSAGLVHLRTDPTATPRSHSYVSPLPQDTANAIAIWAAIRPTCPCCAMTTFAWPRTFYQSRQPMATFDFSKTLDLSDTTTFARIERPYPISLGTSTAGWQYVTEFNRFMVLPVIHPYSHDTTYALASVDSVYLDSTARHYHEGGAIGYPSVICPNTASVRIFRAFDGGLDFRDLAELSINRASRGNTVRRIATLANAGQSTFTITGQRVPANASAVAQNSRAPTRVLITR